MVQLRVSCSSCVCVRCTRRCRRCILTDTLPVRYTLLADLSCLSMRRDLEVAHQPCRRWQDPGTGISLLGNRLLCVWQMSYVQEQTSFALRQTSPGSSHRQRTVFGGHLIRISYDLANGRSMQIVVQQVCASFIRKVGRNVAAVESQVVDGQRGVLGQLFLR